MLLAVIVLASGITVVSTIMSIVLERKLGVLCTDVHKVGKPRVPCNGGFAIYVGLATATILLMLVGFVDRLTGIVVLITLTLSFLIGLADDLIDLKSRWKIVLGLATALPMLVTGLYTPRPWVSFAGFVRISRLYPLLLLAAFTVYQNGSNMIDTHNGVLPVFVLSLHVFALITKLLAGGSIDEPSSALLITFIAVIASYLYFNLYPAKIFNGNTGAFLLGSTIPILLALNRLEFYYLLASAPMYINGFYYIASVKGFLQKESVKRPTRVDERGCIHAVRDPTAPITLVRLAIRFSGSALSEKELVILLYTLFIASSAIASILTLALGYQYPR